MNSTKDMWRHVIAAPSYIKLFNEVINHGDYGGPLGAVLL